MKGQMRSWRLVATLGAVALLAIGVAACGGDDDDDGGDGAVKGFTDAGYKAAGFKVVTIDAGAPIKIGISSALSGDVKGLGEPIANAAEVAFEGVTIKNRKIEVVKEDDLCTPEGGPAAADRLVKAGVVAAVGPICSGGTRASLQIYDKAGITHCSPSATAGDLTAPQRAEGPYVTFFRVPVLNADEARAQADFAKAKGWKTAFILNDTDDYGKDLAAQFKKYFEAGGGKIVGAPAGYEKKQTDFKAIVSNIKQAKPDMVYMAGFFAEGTTFIQQLRAESDLKATPFMGGDGIKNEEFLKAKDAAEGAFLALPGTTAKAEFDAFAAKYAAKTKGKAEDATFGAEAFDCATVLVKALDKIAVEKSGKLEIDLKKLNEAVKTTKDLKGASGTISFGANGDRSGAVVRFFVIKGGKYEEVPATGK